MLLYATEVCPLLARDRSSLEFTFTRVLMKIFCTGSVSVIAECQRHFCFLPVKLQLTIRTTKFLNAFVASQNHICLLFENVATRNLNKKISNFGVKTLAHLTSKVRDQFVQPDVL
jgi:hypothetical protein